MKNDSLLCRFRISLVSILLGVAATAVAQTPTQKDFDFVDGMMRGGVRSFGRAAQQVIVSPDGLKVAWVGESPDGKGPRGLWTMPVDGSAATQLKSADRAGSIAWSPDGAWILFVADNQGRRSMFVVPASGGEARKLLDFTGETSMPVWAPDGQSFAFLGIENPKRVAGATQPFKPETGLVGRTPDVQRIAVVDAKTGALHWASPKDQYIYEFGWSPNSKEIAVTAARPPGENNWWTAKLYAADVTTGQLRLVATPELQINTPRWSPDGRAIAYIGGIMSDFGSIGGDVWLAPSGGGKPRNLTPNLKASANWIHWMQSGAIAVGETVEGESAFELLDPASGKLQQAFRGASSFAGAEGRNSVAVSGDDRVGAYVSSTLTHGAEVFAGPLGQVKQLTHWSDNSQPTWGKAESIHWKNDNFDVQGWLFAPTKMEAGKKYPMIVQVHGGPAAAVTGSWFLGQQASFYNQAGYFVFMPNPRGSYGEGEAFTKANRKDFGYGDFRDIMAGVDKVIATQPVDPNRLGLTGGSYGGYMTMWGVTQTNRFKGAVATAGIANWQSYYGENSIDEWMIPYFGATVYDDPKVYAKSSPIEFIKRVKTPTLVAVGEFDGECPPPQSYEFWHALEVLGVKTELLVYPGEGHGVRQPANSRDLLARSYAWFNYYLK